MILKIMTRDSCANQRKQSSTIVVCFGEMLIDMVPNESGVSLAESGGFIKAAGGASANVACAITKHGGCSTFIGKFGDDEFGQMLVDILKADRVNTQGVCFDKEARTALAFVTLKKNGEREFMFYRNPSADMRLQKSDLNYDLIKTAAIFHYGSISLIAEPCRSAHLAAMKAAKGAGVLLSYDPNLRLPLWESADKARKEIMSIWEEADLIKVSDEEVAFLTKGDPNDKKNVVSTLFIGNVKLLLVTYGEKGCRYFTQNFNGMVEGYAVKAVDTTGCGDAFVGAFLSKLAKNRSLIHNEHKLKEALAFANACGALCTTKKGAIPGLPNSAAARALMSESC